MDWTLPLDQEDHAFLASLRQQFTTCCGEIARQSGKADTVAAAVAAHVASTTSAKLPPAARATWELKIARPLKTDVTKPLPARAVNAVRSWPSSRVAELVAALAEIEAILADFENEAMHEAIYTEISRAYS